ncbi:MAG: alpha/beta hydrolase [Herminiimonas sp.]|nr:alpha/beta hydrolase [Herminiimonas sp.]
MVDHGRISGQISPPALLVRELDVPGAQQNLAARLVAPAAGPIATGLIVFFHQGGFIAGSLDESDEFVRALARRTGLPVLASTYTLAGRRPFPAAVEDAYAVLRWCVQQNTLLGWNGSRLITAGIEAGGNLAAVSALVARDRGGPALAAQMLIMPMLDPGLSSGSMRALKTGPGVAGVADFCAAGYRGYLPRAADRMHPYASPLQSSRLKGLPPALILSAEDDPLRDEAEQYGARLIASGTRTLVRRLPALPLQDGAARCKCAQEASALDEIAGFISELELPF